MKIATCLLMLLLLPPAVYGLSVDVEYDPSAAEGKGFSPAGLSGRADYDSVRTIFRPVPRGYEVKGYRVRWELWEGDEGLISEAAVPGGSVIEIRSGNILGYGLLSVSLRTRRVSEGRSRRLEGVGLTVDLRPRPDDLRVFRRSLIVDHRARCMLEACLGVDARAGTWEVTEADGWISEAPGLEGGAVDCVIVTCDSLSQEFERLARWHDATGVRTVVRTTEWIDSRYPGSDSPERIRNFIRDAFSRWGTLYVLLGGDASTVPIRVLHYPWLWARTGETSDEIPADVYYSNLDGNWNGDGDELLGEVGLANYDGVDLLPDVLVGRAPVGNNAEVRIFVDKTIEYMEGGAPDDWHTRAVFFAQELFETQDGAVKAEEILAEFPPDFDRIRLYENYDQYPGSLPETLENVTESVNQGCGILGHIGHGDFLRLDLGGTFMSRWHIDSLSNDSRYAFLYMMNCASSNPFVESPAKRFLMNPGGGAFALMGNPIFATANFGLSTELKFFQLLFGEGRMSLGALAALSRMHLVDVLNENRWWAYLNNILLGDPVVYLWRSAPESLSVDLPVSLACTDTTVSATITSGGDPVAGARMVVVGDRGEYGRGITDGSGQVVLDYRPAGPGRARVYAVAEDHFVYSDSVEVNGQGGCLYLAEIEVDDGGGDGEAGWGERVGLCLTLANGDTGSVPGVTGDLSAIGGCSLFVDLRLDGVRDTGLVYVGESGASPGTLPFHSGPRPGVFGREPGDYGNRAGCWIWLDSMGWHLRLGSGPDTLAYACSLHVGRGLVGHAGHDLEPDDTLTAAGGALELRGSVFPGDCRDGVDLFTGCAGGVVIHDGTEDYGAVGPGAWGSTRCYDVEFEEGDLDGLGAWFELAFTYGSGTGRTWFRLPVRNGYPEGQRLEYGESSGDTLALRYVILNAGAGELASVEARLRALEGAEVTDSISTYGDIPGGETASGSGFAVRYTGGPVSYELKISDGLGRSWRDTIRVRTPAQVEGLEYLADHSRVTLTWSPPEDSLIWSYDVYRSPPDSQSFQHVGWVEGYTRFVDGGLEPETSYLYCVAARDSFGNPGATSQTLAVRTGPVSLAGWPGELRGAPFSSPVSGDATQNGTKELFIGSKGLEISGFNIGGNLLTGFPYEGTCEIWSSPVLADLDGDGDLECVFGEGEASGAGECRRLVALNHDGSPVTGAHNPRLAPDAPGWPRDVARKIRSSPAVYDLDSDGRPEVLAAIEAWSPEKKGYVYAFRYDGSPYLKGSEVFAETECGVWPTPCVADLDSDGSPEVVVLDKRCGTGLGGNLYIWNHDGTPYMEETGGRVDSTGGSFMASPAVGDIDGDDLPEIVAVQTGGRVWAWNHDGTPLGGSTGQIASLAGATWTSPALGDLDLDGALEIVIGLGHTEGKVVVLRGDGTPFGDSLHVFRWNRSLGYSSPVIADIDGDQYQEIVAASLDGYLFALEGDGTPVPGYPRKFENQIYATPLVDDLDLDGDMEIAVATYAGKLHVLDLEAPYAPDRVAWGMFHHDRWNTGTYGFSAPADTAGPSFTIAVFQNRVVRRSMEVFAVAGENLAGNPLIEVGSTAGRTALDVETVEGRIYRAGHLTQATGADTVYVSATDSYGNQSVESRVITYSQPIGNREVVASWDGVLEASARGTGLAVLPVDTEYLGGDPSLRIEPAGYNLCCLKEGVVDLVIEVDAEGSGEGLYVFDGGWRPVSCVETDGRLHVGRAAPGIYARGGRAPSETVFGISGVRPNPSPGGCEFEITVPSAARLSVSVYDVRGRLVRALYRGRVAGTVKLEWDGRDSSRRLTAPGIYFLRAGTADRSDTRKMIVVR
jgi:hypothetical protein